VTGHFHLGVAHFLAFLSTLIIAGGVLRFGEAWMIGSNIPILQKIGGALAAIY